MKKAVLTLILLLASIKLLASPKFYTKQEIVSNQLNINQKNIELIWGITEITKNNQELFITVHGYQPHIPQVAAIYIRIKKKYQLLKKIISEGYFKIPHSFWFSPQNEDFKEHFIHLTEIHFGTGYFNKEYIYYLKEKKLEKVFFNPAHISFKNFLSPSEGVRKGSQNIFNNSGLFFTFYIWNERDPNCCPSKNKIEGEYKLILTRNNQYKILMKNFKKLPVE